MKAPKNAKTQALIDRMKIYLRDNPTCKLEDAGKVLGVKSCTVRKWKQYGWIEHLTPAQARRKGLLPSGKPLPQQQAAPAQQQQTGKRQRSSGVVALPSPAIAPAGADDIDSLIAKGKDLKVSQLRSLIKAHLMMSVSDSKAVSNYAAGLKALAGVQDVELEDIYENEQLIKIYVPQEDSLILSDVVEVDQIEY